MFRTVINARSDCQSSVTVAYCL